nr:transposase family protein [Deinococcus betulae]
MDHSPLDVHLVHPVTRLSMGRATLTLVICTCSRLILGFLVSFQKPSIMSVALALSHAVLPKEAWLRARGFDPFVWPVAGLPQAIQVDNAREFHSAAFETACARWNIQIHYRRKGRPRDGSLMENVLGTMNRAQHSLPGTTFSNPRERQRYPSEDRAVMSLIEFEVWLTHKVISYNHRCGRSEGWAPAQRHALGDFTSRPVHDPATFTLDFLPQEERVVTETGIELFTDQYWTEELKLFAGQRVLVKYDPLNLGHIWVYDSVRRGYLEVPYRDATKAPKSYWTYLAERRERTRQRDEVQLTRVLSHHRQAKEVVKAASQHTRRAKRQQGHVRSFDLVSHAQGAPAPTPQAELNWPSAETPLEPWPIS